MSSANVGASLMIPMILRPGSSTPFFTGFRVQFYFPMPTDNHPSWAPGDTLHHCSRGFGTGTKPYCAVGENVLRALSAKVECSGAGSLPSGESVENIPYLEPINSLSFQVIKKLRTATLLQLGIRTRRYGF
ncbi:Hypothetical predicted protein [Podarcis lilfordi]|uniref:Uncharacterized protein n=1 Tax=Podarcis lilfordi TaxID=74358 RepID=A0AA35LLK2_9SAUR|nr:Hypothetical predicted protein [Podarcis lilfordi]